jgi:hypothetical protein
LLAFTAHLGWSSSHVEDLLCCLCGLSALNEAALVLVEEAEALVNSHSQLLVVKLTQALHVSTSAQQETKQPYGEHAGC